MPTCVHPHAAPTPIRKAGAQKPLCLLAALLAAFLLTGCQSGANKRFTAKNEIITYQKIDPQKTQLVVSTLGNNANVGLFANEFSAAFEARNPDVQIIFLDITGGNDDYRPVVDWVANGMAPDIMFVNPNTFTDEAFITERFQNLSANPVLDNFELSALNKTAIRANIYLLPGPSEINCMIYNKTLFEEYGWQVPATFDQFITLCLQIRRDTNGAIQPWNPNAKYDSVFTIATEAFMYEELFGGIDNRGWYQDFCAGNASYAPHMKPYYDMLQTLIDNRILLEEHFTYSATTRGKEFAGGQIAMINSPVSNFNSNEYTFDYMPYPTTAGNRGYVNDVFSSFVCVPLKTHTDKEQAAIDSFLAFFASVEGQRALIADTLMVSNVKNVPLAQEKNMASIGNAIAQGYKFSRLDFLGAGKRNWTFQDHALSMVTGEKTGAECMAEVDEEPYLAEKEAAAASAQPLATVAEDFTMLEFSNYIADLYREKTGADVGLINHGVAYRGNLIRLFKGELPESYVQVLLPRSFDNGSALVKASMTGQQLTEALNHPMGNGYVSNSVYAFSGLQCQVAPWNEPGHKYLSVKLADGAALEPDRLYTVAFWGGTVAEEYITEVLETYEGSWVELMKAKLAADGTIAPAKDGRIALTWN